MGCSPSKGNVVHPTSNSSSTKPNGSIPENSSTTTNGTSGTKHFITENTKELDESLSNQNDCNDQQLKESESITTSNSASTTSTIPSIASAYNDSYQLPHVVNDVLQHHGNHEYHVLGNQPLVPVPKLPYPKPVSLRASHLRGAGTESQVEFFKMLDRKIEAGPDYEGK